MAFFEDFKKFAFKGNVVDLAVGVVIGGAFGKIVTAVVADVVMPLVSLVLPSGDWRMSGFVLRTAADPKDNVVLKYGDFVGAVLDFFVVALALYIIVSQLVKAAEERFVHHRDPAAPPPAIKECPYCLETIPAKATRCKSCTAQQPTAAEPGT
ncbi:MAG: large conductance mechanosensitive channel protein MscL [Pseudomonadota bacterium]